MSEDNSSLGVSINQALHNSYPEIIHTAVETNLTDEFEKISKDLDNLMTYFNSNEPVALAELYDFGGNRREKTQEKWNEHKRARLYRDLTKNVKSSIKNKEYKAKRKM